MSSMELVPAGEPREIPRIKPDIWRHLNRIALKVTHLRDFLLYGVDPDPQTLSDYPKSQDVPLSQIEALQRGENLFEYGGIRIFHPENPLLKEAFSENGENRGEGLHLRIEAKDVPVHPKTPEEWRKFKLAWGLALGTGKVMSEGAGGEFWQSFVGKTEFAPQDHLVIEVMGRRPTGESWGKTAPFPKPDYDHRQARIPDTDLQPLQRTLSRFFTRYWVPELRNVDLFESEPIVYPPESPQFVKQNERIPGQPYYWKNETLVMTDRWRLEAVMAAHLTSGMHLMVQYPEGKAPVRPWEDLTTSLEVLTAAEVAAQLLTESSYQGKPLAADASVRATGSWYGGFGELKRDLPYYKEASRYVLKRLLRRNLKGEALRLNARWAGMHFHPHIYATEHPDERIRLFSRSIEYGDKEWETLRPIRRDKVLFIRQILNERFKLRLAAARGKLVT